MSLLLLFQPAAASSATSLSAQHAAWLEGLARIMGLIDPMQVTASGRGDGTVVQSWTNSNDVTVITTSAAPTGAAGPSALTAQQAGWLEALARAHGLIDPLTIRPTGRTDGTLAQTWAPGSTVTITRTA